jgi:hypothetical protein
MRLIIGIFIAWCVAILAYDLGLRLPLDASVQIALVGMLGVVLWPIVSSFSHEHDDHAHHHH